MRCGKANGWMAMRSFLHSGAPEAVMTLNVPNKQDALDYACSCVAPAGRLVRQVTPDGLIRVLATNLDAQSFPCARFADLYHQRWRIEEAFNRLKHRLKLESVSGLPQNAVLVDVAAKVLADNLGSLACLGASEAHDLVPRGRVRN